MDIKDIVLIITSVCGVVTAIGSLGLGLINFLRDKKFRRLEVKKNILNIWNIAQKEMIEKGLKEFDERFVEQEKIKVIWDYYEKLCSVLRFNGLIKRSSLGIKKEDVNSEIMVYCVECEKRYSLNKVFKKRINDSMTINRYRISRVFLWKIKMRGWKGKKEILCIQKCFLNNCNN
ncbi:hypothetical protein SCORR_v1c10410 (plasmid) [Spiroplasma corruscae]|uniref:Uncharacterized protein n=1 Tax=Spiroplasma corruscae TaxID=216934 RepID=A0A222ERN7_9MOLU|nr:hypothetical protein [Spiroplasma corruscae]ASP28813.1 hypothetical protein SCORR_v1c10410 [Spiroplasma corruscae]